MGINTIITSVFDSDECVPSSPDWGIAQNTTISEVTASLSTLLSSQDTHGIVSYALTDLFVAVSSALLECVATKRPISTLKEARAEMELREIIQGLSRDDIRECYQGAYQGFERFWEQGCSEFIEQFDLNVPLTPDDTAHVCNTFMTLGNALRNAVNYIRSENTEDAEDNALIALRTVFTTILDKLQWSLIDYTPKDKHKAAWFKTLSLPQYAHNILFQILVLSGGLLETNSDAIDDIKTDKDDSDKTGEQTEHRVSPITAESAWLANYYALPHKWYYRFPVFLDNREIAEVEMVGDDNLHLPDGINIPTLYNVLMDTIYAPSKSTAKKRENLKALMQSLIMTEIEGKWSKEQCAQFYRLSHEILSKSEMAHEDDDKAQFLEHCQQGQRSFLRFVVKDAISHGGLFLQLIPPAKIHGTLLQMFFENEIDLFELENGLQLLQTVDATTEFKYDLRHLILSDNSEIRFSGMDNNVNNDGIKWLFSASYDLDFFRTYLNILTNKKKRNKLPPSILNQLADEFNVIKTQMGHVFILSPTLSAQAAHVLNNALLSDRDGKNSANTERRESIRARVDTASDAKENKQKQGDTTRLQISQKLFKRKDGQRADEFAEQITQQIRKTASQGAKAQKFERQAKEMFQFLHDQADSVVQFLKTIDYHDYADLTFNIEKTEEDVLTNTIEMMPFFEEPDDTFVYLLLSTYLFGKPIYKLDTEHDLSMAILSYALIGIVRDMYHCINEYGDFRDFARFLSMAKYDSRIEAETQKYQHCIDDLYNKLHMFPDNLQQAIYDFIATNFFTNILQNVPMWYGVDWGEDFFGAPEPHEFLLGVFDIDLWNWDTVQDKERYILLRNHIRKMIGQYSYAQRPKNEIVSSLSKRQEMFAFAIMLLSMNLSAKTSMNILHRYKQPSSFYDIGYRVANTFQLVDFDGYGKIPLQELANNLKKVYSDVSLRKISPMIKYIFDDDVFDDDYPDDTHEAAKAKMREFISMTIKQLYRWEDALFPFTDNERIWSEHEILKGAREYEEFSQIITPDDIPLFEIVMMRRRILGAYGRDEVRCDNVNCKGRHGGIDMDMYFPDDHYPILEEISMRLLYSIIRLRIDKQIAENKKNRETK